MSSESSSPKPSIATPSGPEKDLTLDFSFERDVNRDVGDVIRFGAFGRFKESRLLVEDTLQQFDNIFPVAVEIMRLMYDQGDLSQLLAYTSTVLAPDDLRTKNESWSPGAMCILRLFRDLCVMHDDKGLGSNTEILDVPVVEPDGSHYEDWNEEQILSSVLLLESRCPAHGTKRESPTNWTSLPPSLQKPEDVCGFLTYLLSQRHYWAAMSVLATCFRSQDIDCLKIWTSVEHCLHHGSLYGGQDESDIVSRLALITTFLEGLSYCGLEQLATLPSGSLPSWSQLLTMHSRLREELEQVSGANDWLDSRDHIRLQIIAFDKEIYDRNDDRVLYSGSEDNLRLTGLQKNAEQNGDWKLLDGIRWRIDVLTNNKDPDTTSLPQSIVGVPVRIYSRRFVDVQSLLAALKKDSSSKPLVIEAHTQKHGSAAESNRSVEAPTTRRSGGLKLVPWTYSPALGGEYIYNPQSDRIIFKDGRSLARPAKISKTSLSSAAWTGNPGAPFQNMDRLQEMAYITGASSPQQLALRGGTAPANRPMLAANARPGRAHAPMRGEPATQAGDQMSGQNRGAYQEISSRIENPVVSQPKTQSQVDNGRLRLPNAREPGINIGVESITSTLSPSFKARSHEFFGVGRVFQVLWSVPAGDTSSVPSWDSGIVLDEYEKRVFSKVRSFVVIRAAGDHCNALPINSYGGRGVAKRGVKKSEHVIVFSRGSEPPQPARSEKPRRGEQGMLSMPIRIDPDSQGDHLNSMARLNLAGVTTVHHSIKAKSVGKVNDRSLPALLNQFGVVFGTQQLHTPLTRPVPVSTSGVARDDDDDSNSDNDDAAQAETNDDDDADDDDEDGDEDEDFSDESEDARVAGQRVIEQQPFALC